MSCSVCKDFLSPPGSEALSFKSVDLDYAVLTPYVEVVVSSAEGKKITVGPNSMSPDNTVSILSFEYGSVGASGNGGLSMKIELIDEKGGEFYSFAESLWKCMQSEGSSNTISVKWGWIGVNCDGSPKPILINQPVKGILIMLDVSFAEGKFKYTLNATDIGPITAAAKNADTFGSTDKWIPIKQAIEELCDTAPKCKVVFKNLKDPKSEFKWHDGTKDGPKNYWPCKLGSKIQVINSWIHDMTSSEGKGFIVVNDNTASEPTLIVSERIVPEENYMAAKDLSLGTFIVNGGECSLVLDFNTNFNWLLGMHSFNIGGTIDPNGKAVNADAKYDEDTKAPQQENAGLGTSTVINQRVNDIRSQDEAGEATVKANQEALKSMAAPGGAANIEAQLRIMGVPKDDFVHPVFNGKIFCGVIVINPFALQAGEGGCANWLQTSLCNKVLSNPFWIIKGVNHMIKDGNYTTTFKLTLAAPMIQFTPDSPLGGPGSSGSSFGCSGSGGGGNPPIAASNNFINQQLNSISGLA